MHLPPAHRPIQVMKTSLLLFCGRLLTPSRQPEGNDQHRLLVKQVRCISYGDREAGAGLSIKGDVSHLSLNTPPGTKSDGGGEVGMGHTFSDAKFIEVFMLCAGYHWP